MQADFPAKLQCLFQSKRYKILYGGRGGAKSWGVARALLIMAASRPLRILCAREFQKSIKDSVHRLLSDQIKELGLDTFYEIQQTIIKGKNGSTFAFEGLKHNTTNIKSYEAVDIAWVEEAQNVSKTSWDILIPTIRAEGSEIWVTFNPELEDDATYQRFVVNPPTDSTVVKIGWADNPWFPSVLQQEMADLKQRDPDAYLNVWEGHCRKCLEGAIYAEELRKLQEDGRLCSVPYDASKQVDTFWDLGWADNTSIWFAQTVGMEIRVIDFYQNNLQSIQHYADTIRSRGYVLGTCYLPPDARAKQLGTGRSVEELLRSMGFTVVIVPMLSVADGIAAARTLFSSVWIDDRKCADGISDLRRYRYDVDPNTGTWSKQPLHDNSSHAADAWRYLAVGYRKPVTKQKDHYIPPSSWMGI